MFLIAAQLIFKTMLYYYAQCNFIYLAENCYKTIYKKDSIHTKTIDNYSSNQAALIRKINSQKHCHQKPFANQKNS